MISGFPPSGIEGGIGGLAHRNPIRGATPSSRLSPVSPLGTLTTLCLRLRGWPQLAEEENPVNPDLVALLYAVFVEHFPCARQSPYSSARTDGICVWGLCHSKPLMILGQAHLRAAGCGCATNLRRLRMAPLPAPLRSV